MQPLSLEKDYEPPLAKAFPHYFQLGEKEIERLVEAYGNQEERKND